jgi:hypothetical protein
VGGIARISGAELPAGFDFDAARSQGQMNVGMAGQKGRVDLEERCLGNGDPEVIQQDCGQEFVDENAAVLRVIAELDDVVIPVICLQQMGLGASSHFSDMPDGGERHRKENAVI